MEEVKVEEREFRDDKQGFLLRTKRLKVENERLNAMLD
jgi:hypothetical protein